jgi:transposase
VDAQRRIAELEAALAAAGADRAAEWSRSLRLEQQIGELLGQVTALTQRVAELTERLGQNSRNSHLPPSSDPPGTAGKSGGGQRPKSARPRGGQRGHRGARRELVAADEVNDIVDLYPAECENCWAALPEQPDPDAKRYQWIEVPPLQPYIKETRRHEVACPCCGHKTRAPYDEHEIPASPFGPRLMSMVALLTGVYHVSRRNAAKLLSDLVGVPISLGAVSAVEARVSDAVEPPVIEAWKRIDGAPVKHTDGTTWLKAGVVLALWTIASTAATVFKIVADGSRATLAPLYGALRGILVSDRAAALSFWAMERRQICWAHLLRKYVSFSERAGPAGEMGRQLLDYTGLLFDYWHDYKAGRLDRAMFLAWMAPVRAQVEAVLERAAASGIDRLAGSCANILEHRAALWTFVDTHDVEPTNNHAERELRTFVLWRKRCFGTQSERGNLFAERLMTVAHTARKQRKDVLAFLTACCQAQLDGTRAPSLFAAA